jgi:hypothetical protein
VVADTSNNRLQVYSIVGSGGSFTTSARRFLDQPVWVFSIPLLLLLAAIVLLVINRRRAQAAEGAVGAE